MRIKKCFNLFKHFDNSILGRDLFGKNAFV